MAVFCPPMKNKTLYCIRLTHGIYYHSDHAEGVDCHKADRFNMEAAKRRLEALRAAGYRPQLENAHASHWGETGRYKQAKVIRE